VDEKPNFVRSGKILRLARGLLQAGDGTVTHSRIHELLVHLAIRTLLAVVSDVPSRHDNLREAVTFPEEGIFSS
jgi:hypothetical protein